MFDHDLSGDLGGADTPLADGSQKMAIFKGRRWLYVLWVLIGIIVAFERSYITISLLKLVLSALLAIFLWPLVLLGISLHVH
jgi:hypothetical protein